MGIGSRRACRVALAAVMAVGLGTAGAAVAADNGSAPVADPDGPYSAVAEVPTTFDGTGSTLSDADYALIAGGERTWAQAEVLARSSTAFPQCASTHLATITGQQEQDTLDGLFGGTLSLAWLGGFQDPAGFEPAGGWQWVTGEPWSFTNWQPGEPNDEGGEDVLGVGGGVAGQWNDFSAGRTLGRYLLEAEGCPVHYTWDFGDGAVASDAGARPQHTYTQAGTFTVALTVTDALGRPATASTTVTVWSVPMLRDAVEGLGLPPGIENSLLAKLSAAQASIEDGRPAVAANQLGAFVAAVRAQSGKAIAAPDAVTLIGTAEAMQRVLTR